jgi:hypothetical protein
MDMPALLSAAALSNFDNYSIGYPYREEDKELCVRFSALKEEGFEFLVHIALPKVPEIEAYSYFDLILNYLTEHDYTCYGFGTGTVLIDMGDDYTTGAINAYFSVILPIFFDDCG